MGKTTAIYANIMGGFYIESDIFAVIMLPSVEQVKPKWYIESKPLLWLKPYWLYLPRNTTLFMPQLYFLLYSCLYQYCQPLLNGGNG